MWLPALRASQETGPPVGFKYLPCTSAYQGQEVSEPAGPHRVEYCIALVQGFMFRAAFLRKVPLFIRNFTENVVLCLLASCVESTANRFLEQLKLKWRSMLTERVHKQYFKQMVRTASCQYLQACT